ncbi:N-acetyltransferase [Clostridium cylindrosporum]|uniref:Putative N-acetyltransferase YoaP n=1 Tax=Clostridium cylindrosporum DSM 605 TaxID=1121307 RepID=A0A0J8DGQ4_CLOCY|nr:GNAT family N-acetyltransferase [Clostridium cylindrosporum]KMT23373.1 putative N-acetyltransferase YoaP [Clostridium cylindrosporum DSM 605]
MHIINVNSENIDREHICCAISDKRGEGCITSKKQWMKEQFDNGLIFKKLNVRGKVFVEYIPAENAWSPIEANGYIFINCLWVSGKYKGQGYANKLLEECINDTKLWNRKGLVILSSKKKMPFLSDANYLKYKGFKICDEAHPYYELLYLPFEDEIEKPRFKECSKKGLIDKRGIVLYYSSQCPHTEKYAYLISEIARSKGVEFTSIRYKSKEEAQNAPAPFTTYSLFYDRKFVTNEILSEKKFINFLENRGL